MANGGKQLSDNNPSGTVLGQSSTDAIGFYGATPVARYSTSVGIPTSTAPVSISATQWGFASSAQAQAVLTAVIGLTTAMSNMGLTSAT